MTCKIRCTPFGTHPIFCILNTIQKPNSISQADTTIFISPLPPPNYSILVACYYRGFLSADLQSRDPETFKPLHVVNMTIKDSPEEAEAAANDVLFLCRTVIIRFLGRFHFSVGLTAVVYIVGAHNNNNIKSILSASLCRHFG